MPPPLILRYFDDYFCRCCFLYAITPFAASAIAFAADTAACRRRRHIYAAGAIADTIRQMLDID